MQQNSTMVLVIKINPLFMVKKDEKETKVVKKKTTSKPKNSTTEKSTKKVKNSVDKILVGIGVAVGFTLLGVALSITMILNQSNQAAQAPAADTIVAEVSVDDDAILGNKNAPVTIIEFSDYGCPYCGRHAQETLPQIKSEYIDKGLVKLVFRDFAFKGEKSQNLAALAECAGEIKGDSGFYEAHDMIYSNQGQSAEFVLDKLLEAGYGADLTACFESGDMISEVMADFEDAKAYGVNSTPTFFINGQKLVGAQPFSAFAQVIDQKLSEIQ